MPRNAEKLTKRSLDALRRKAEADRSFTAYVADAGQPGLYAWARRGRLRFVFAYRPPAGGPRTRLKIDDFGAITLDQARAIAGYLRGQVAAGVDPRQERAEEQRRAVTVAEAVEGYLGDLRERVETRAKRGKRSGYVTARSRLERHVLPKLGGRRIRDVTPDHVRRMHRAMSKTPVEANRTLTALSAVFGWADRAELVPASFNPCRHVERYAETGTRRALTPEELAALGAAVHDAEGSLHSSAVLAIRFLALTGFRRAELIGHMSKDRRGGREGLRWGDVDLDTGLVTLHDSKTGRQVRVIGQAAIELLRQVRPDKVEDDEPVCPGAVPGQPYIGIDRARKKLWATAGLDGADLHSLRHSFASIGAHVQSGRFAGHVSALLGHGYQSRAITERYITANPRDSDPPPMPSPARSHGCSDSVSRRRWWHSRRPQSVHRLQVVGRFIPEKVSQLADPARTRRKQGVLVARSTR